MPGRQPGGQQDITDYDTVIIGAGPAGASCALWLKRLGLNPLLLERCDRPGGLLNDSPFQNDWLVTQPGVTGIELSANIGRSLAAADVALRCDCAVTEIQQREGGFIISFDERGRQGIARAPHVVLATGVRAISGGLTGGERVLIGPGAAIMQRDFTGQRVAILGGGDNALENYAFVREKGAASAHIFARSLRAQRARIRAADSADVRVGAYAVDDAVPAVNGQAYDLLLVMYGWEPSPVPLSGLAPKRDPKGFLLVDPGSCETSEAGLYAVGELTRHGHPCIPTAMADGVQAAKSIQKIVERS
ncbi:NAD(P)/FAD-dependent oxidoreductase [Terrihabitans sp. B22-R8]|uniref:NAD(P)/FAD-dependent oxidoreductase n=1 Tax=Terrihabitans sp. B22-R8 TaxID=3425128 RepID=UPI00403C085F